MGDRVPVLAVAVPAYQVETEPDHRAVGRIVDAELKRHFMGRTVLVRALGSVDHPGRSLDELIEIIARTGTDRYDPNRAGDRYDNVDGRHIDLFAFRRKVTPRMRVFEYLSWGFYHAALEFGRPQTRLDVLTVYDAARLRVVPHRYAGRTDLKRDGYAFRDPGRKREALLGIVRLD